MKNEIMMFKENEVEVLELNGIILFNPYHVGKCLELGDSSIRMALSSMNNKQVIKIKNSDVNSIDIRKLNNAGENFLTESGVYKLVFKSRKQNAEEFTDWIADEVLPSIRQTGSYEMPNKEKPTTDRTKVMLLNARTRQANLYYKLSKLDTLSPTYKKILVSKAAEVLSGEQIIALPKSERKVYSAKEIGDMLGVSANKIGRIANKHGLKTEEYGEYRRDKSQYSAREVDTWVYYDNVIPAISEILSKEVM